MFPGGPAHAQPPSSPSVPSPSRRAPGKCPPPPRSPSPGGLSGSPRAPRCSGCGPDGLSGLGAPRGCACPAPRPRPAAAPRGPRRTFAALQMGCGARGRVPNPRGRPCLPAQAPRSLAQPPPHQRLWPQSPRVENGDKGSSSRSYCRD